MSIDHPYTSSIPPIVDFHNHYVPGRFELTAAKTAPANQRARWDTIARKISDENLCWGSIRTGEISARVVNIPNALIADADGHVPHKRSWRPMNTLPTWW